MNSLSNLSKHLTIPAAFVLAAHFNALAQSPVESTHVDEKYAYTTVVYKNTAATDKDVLSSLENSFSIGDVVRVTLAPPPTPIAASEPVYADHRKDENEWMPTSARISDNLTASAKINPVPKTVVNTIPISPKPTPIASKTVALKPVVATKTTEVVPEQAKNIAPVQGQKVEAAPLNTSSETRAKAKTSSTGKSAKAHKSGKKPAKKSGLKMKNRKHNKQRYSCPKF